ncbi:MAG TPA: PepSY-associated TM helix domain-containing protein, partial [Hanamia sp.]
MARAIRNTSWKRIRNLLRNIHLWAGLASGIVVVAICFSGTVYVFNTELTEMAAPHLYKVKTADDAHRIPAENLLNKISNEAGGAVTTIWVPADANRTYRFDVKKEGDKSRNGTSYFVNPYSGEITGTSLEESRTKQFMSTMFSLHRWLLLDKIETPLFSGITNKELGSKITGWATILFTLGCLTGICIWFPNKLRHWRQGLKIKTNGNRKRLIHDLHNAPAFYAFIFLLLMGITGPQWSFPWYRTGMQKALGTYQPKAIEAKEKPS